MTERARSTIPTAVPDSDSDPIRCPYCDRPFTRDRYLTLHVGEEHPGLMTEEERGAFADAMDQESDDLFVLHLKVVAALVLLFFFIAYLYAFVLAG